MKPERGSYILLISLDRDAVITVGKLGAFSFRQGYYLYAGSALGGLMGRINRHLKGNKKLHWHIDYLLAQSRIVEVWYASSAERLECRFAEAALLLKGAQIPVKGFGSSDCRCPSHLVYLSERPTLSRFQAALDEVSPARIGLRCLELPDGR
ncbi:MAG: GIY-YIG nuclease family protein [Dehalococcoidia bacterium]|nr:GIY-YIG nuclease family protein [Dehalococcoidia bacterium]